MTGLHGAPVAVSCGSAGDVSLLRLTERHAAGSSSKLQRIGHRNIGRGKRFARQIGRMRELPRHQAAPAVEYFHRLARTPVVLLTLGCEIAADDENVHGHREPSFAEMKELLISREGKI